MTKIFAAASGWISVISKEKIFAASVDEACPARPVLRKSVPLAPGDSGVSPLAG